MVHGVINVISVSQYPIRWLHTHTHTHTVLRSSTLHYVLPIPIAYRASPIQLYLLA